MAKCYSAHKKFDPVANGKIQVGTLPKWTRVQGKVAWWVAKGPFASLGRAWDTFAMNVYSGRYGTPNGPAGDVYPCSPMDHVPDHERKLLTILYVPVE